MNTNSVLEFLKIFSQFTDFNADEVCSSEKLFIPTSKDEFLTAMKSQRTSDLEQPLRIWTDYTRTNETFFWSYTAQSWWSNQNENQLGFNKSYVFRPNCMYHTIKSMKRTHKAHGKLK